MMGNVFAHMYREKKKLFSVSLILKKGVAHLALIKTQDLVDCDLSHVPSQRRKTRKYLWDRFVAYGMLKRQCTLLYVGRKS